MKKTIALKDLFFSKTGAAFALIILIAIVTICGMEKEEPLTEQQKEGLKLWETWVKCV